MSRNTLLSLYVEDVPEVYKMTEYQKRVKDRKEVHSYIERYKQLPVSAILNKDNIKEDIEQHYCAKVAAATDVHEMKDFIHGEVQIFRLRIDQAQEKDVLKLFTSEYLPRLQEEVLYTQEDGILKIKIDNNSINWLGEVKDASISDKINREIVRSKSVYVTAHFTKYAVIRDIIELGLVTSGIDGIRSILTRGFEDLLKHTTQTLYLSGVPKEYAVSIPVAAVTMMQLQTKCVPPCISGILDKLKEKRHLKYDDRSNLNNFLKAAGVPLEDALALYKTHFSCTATEFDRKYKYNIQHAYGLVGGRINYKSTPCSKVISDGKKSECVGCPLSNGLNPQKECTKSLERITGKQEVLIASPSEYYLRVLRAQQSKEN
ncbi:DNA primase large subunit [Nematocida sp. AWRm78]|nr:DNA primase large subunit [Nematocida sp. AWRm79]KAI5183998.1 DNA primase large subunit [Nematocida sp. AWRm78]